MRLRNKPWALDYINEHQDVIIPNPEAFKGKWHEIFGNNNPIHIEDDVLGEPYKEKYCGQNQCEARALKEVGSDTVYGFAFGHKARVNKHRDYV